MKKEKTQLRLQRLKSLERGNKRTEKNTNQAIESGFQSTSQERTLKLIRPLNNISLLERSCYLKEFKEKCIFLIKICLYISFKNIFILTTLEKTKIMSL